jgi:hypothetical protein
MRSQLTEIRCACVVSSVVGSVSMQLGQGGLSTKNMHHIVLPVPGLFLAKRLISVRHSLLPVPADIRPPVHPQRHTLMICHAFFYKTIAKSENSTCGTPAGFLSKTVAVSLFEVTHTCSPPVIHISVSALGSTQPLIQWVPGISRG